ncbi:MAG: YegS/Rv2252/BmrU family lipid kinase [Alistipes putredinis]|nr:MAG: YegS/Rv2252/BmrU family lipid kinase [Alistipes putredinis]
MPERNASLLVWTVFDHILVAGGDGSINYVVNHLRACGADIPIAILPTGTANDFAKLLGMPSNIEHAVKAILEGERRRVDLGCVNGTYFVNVCSCGLFTNVSQQTPTVAKNIFGRLSYIVGGAVDLTHLHKMQLDIVSDGGTFSGEALMFLVFNGKSAGNFKLAYRSEVDDGLLDVLVVKGDSAIETTHTFFSSIFRASAQSRARTTRAKSCISNAAACTPSATGSNRRT